MDKGQSSTMEQKEAECAKTLALQREIARMLTSSPREMLAASNAFICGWMARESVERKLA